MNNKPILSIPIAFGAMTGFSYPLAFFRNPGWFYEAFRSGDIARNQPEAIEVANIIFDRISCIRYPGQQSTCFSGAAATRVMDARKSYPRRIRNLSSIVEDFLLKPIGSATEESAQAFFAHDSNFVLGEETQHGHD